MVYLSPTNTYKGYYLIFPKGKHDTTQAANYLYKENMVLWQQPQNLPPSNLSTTKKRISLQSIFCLQPTTRKLTQRDSMAQQMVDNKR